MLKPTGTCAQPSLKYWNYRRNIVDAKLTAMITEAATKGLVDQGKLIEAGFAAFKMMTLQHASPEQIADMRIAFFAGAQHLWGSVMTMLDPGENETDADMS